MNQIKTNEQAWHTNHLKMALQFLSSVKGITDLFIAEYFVEHLFYQLPEKWQDCIPTISLDEIRTQILTCSLGGNKVRSVWPLSLLSYIASCHAFSLSSTCIPEIKDNTDFIGSEEICHRDYDDDCIWDEIVNIVLEGKRLNTINPRQKGQATMLLPHSFRRHVKPKKQYEIDVVAKITDAVAKRQKVDSIVDVGAGLGHLSRLLSFGYNYHVTSVEAKGHFNSTAEKFDNEAERDRTRYADRMTLSKNEDLLQTATTDSPRHINFWIDVDISSEAFSSLINKSSHAFDKECPLSRGSSNDANIRNDFSRSTVSNTNTSATATLDSTRKETERLVINDDPVSYICKDRSPSDNSLILVGLHTCGDLASTLLRVFSRCENIRGIVLIGCCYMKLTYFEELLVTPLNTNRSDDPSGMTMLRCSKLDGNKCASYANIDDDNTKCLACHARGKTLISTNVIGQSNRDWVSQNLNIDKEKYGYPLSRFLWKSGQQPIDYNGFELACHFLDSYKMKLKEHSPSLKLHCYRAVLEVLIRQLNPSMKLTPVHCKKIKNSCELPFEEYADKALKRIGLTLEKPISDYLNYESLLAKWKDVVVLYSLRLLLGPVIESVTLLDRYLYLIEQGFHTRLMPIFDPEISPRNFAVIALK